MLHGKADREVKYWHFL